MASLGPEATPTSPLKIASFVLCFLAVSFLCASLGLDLAGVFGGWGHTMEMVVLGMLVFLWWCGLVLDLLRWHGLEAD